MKKMQCVILAGILPGLFLTGFGHARGVRQDPAGEISMLPGASQTASDGLLAWNTFAGGTTDGEGYAVAVDGVGNVYVAGLSDASWGSPIRPFTGSWDAVVFKLGSDGSLIWNTFLGGASGDSALGITVDEIGNVYVLGGSFGDWGSPVRPYTANTDVYVAKLANDGALIWNTFLGSASDDIAGGIASVPGGGVCVAGTSYGSWGSPVRGFAGSRNGFAAKLASDGSLTWNTFLGGGSDVGTSIALDPTGNAYVAGWSLGSWGSPVRAHSAGYDATVVKLLGDGSLAWNTFLGGAGLETGDGIAVNADGVSFLVGRDDSTWGSPIRAYSGAGDILAARVEADGSLAWNTFLGGSGGEFGGEIALDPSGNVYVAASTGASWGSPVRAFSAGEDGWAAKLTGNGSLLWNTFVGGSDDDPAYGLAADACGNIYITGDSYASWGSPVSAFTPGFENIYVAKIASSSCPILTSIKSKKGKPDTRATLYGFNFSTSKSKNTVYFGKYKAKINKATGTKLQVTIPAKSKPGEVGVTAIVNSIKSNTLTFHIK